MAALAIAATATAAATTAATAAADERRATGRQNGSSEQTKSHHIARLFARSFAWRHKHLGTGSGAGRLLMFPPAPVKGNGWRVRPVWWPEWCEL